MGAEGGIFAIHPEICEYREVLVCRVCACDAAHYGIRTVELMKARQIIRSHEAAVEREKFFLQFVPAQEEQAMSA